VIAEIPGRVTDWLTEPVPRGRVAAFRTVVYLFVAADPLWFTPWVRSHADIPGQYYQPLFVGRLLHLPTPNAVLVYGIFAALVPLALAAATGRAPRLLGWTVFALYFEWMIIAMSYGKVDHDRFGLLVALAVLPTCGPARHGDRTPTRAGGWALRLTQLGVVATYFLASWAKLRFGGIEWLTSATLQRAIIRRGTVLTHPLQAHPWALVASQFGIVAFELASPVVFLVRPRVRYAIVGFFYAFHVMVMATITISFAPHQAAMSSFLPLERVRPVLWTRNWWRRRHGRPPLAADPLVSTDPSVEGDVESPAAATDLSTEGATAPRDVGAGVTGTESR
jgi:hypothetical protein